VDHGVCSVTPIEERPALCAALASLPEHGAGLLVVAKRDRIARDVVLAAMVERAAAGNGAQVASAAGEGNDYTPADAFMRTVIDGASQYERGLRPPWWAPSNNRVMLICRISDKKQREGASLDTQQCEQEQYACGADLKVTTIESFQETAKESELRDQFHAAIAKALRIGIRHIVFYVYDRIARNFTDAEKLEKLIRADKLTLHIARSRNVLYAGSDDSEFMLLDFNILQAKQENRARSRRCPSGKGA